MWASTIGTVLVSKMFGTSFAHLSEIKVSVLLGHLSINQYPIASLTGQCGFTQLLYWLNTGSVCSGFPASIQHSPKLSHWESHLWNMTGDLVFSSFPPLELFHDNYSNAFIKKNTHLDWNQMLRNWLIDIFMLSKDVISKKIAPPYWRLRALWSS